MRSVWRMCKYLWKDHARQTSVCTCTLCFEFCCVSSNTHINHLHNTLSRCIISAFFIVTFIINLKQQTSLKLLIHFASIQTTLEFSWGTIVCYHDGVVNGHHWQVIGRWPGCVFLSTATHDSSDNLRSMDKRMAELGLDAGGSL